MPYPSQVTRESILAAAIVLIEREGAEGLTLARLAQTLGIKAPSLYKHVTDKAALLKLVNTDTYQRLIEKLQAGSDVPLQAQIIERITTYRQFALAHPHLYQLAFDSSQASTRPDAAVLEALAIPFQALLARAVAPAQSLSALRGLLALTHGFVVLELGNQFQRGGDIELAFHQALLAYLRGWNL